MKMVNRELALLRYGQPATPLAPMSLKAGALRGFYSQGMLRRIKAGDFEVIRMIYAALRDRNWQTIAPVILKDSGTVNDERFIIARSCEYKEKDIHFRAEYTITGGSDNRIIYSMEGVAESTFLKNRIGLCILHPMKGYTGKECTVVTPESKMITCRFPVDISPHQPMKNIRSLCWAIPGAAKVTLHLEGDIFEMEDQRNWSDASFKTYSTPLEKPFPSEIRKGDTVSQRVILELSGEQPLWQEGDPQIFSVRFDPGHQGCDFPCIGLGRSAEQDKLTVQDASRIAGQGFDHYRLELCLFKPGWQDELERASEESADLRLPLELALYVGADHDQEVKEFLRVYRIYRPFLSRLMIFTKGHTHDGVTTGTLIPLLKKELGNLPAGTGTDANFAELNRNRPPTHTLDFITFAVCPQVHATDHQTLFENLEAQADVVKSARAFASGKDICISAVTLKQRFNAAAKAAEPVAPERHLPLEADPRQVSLLCSAWTLGSIKYLGEQGTRSVTYYETVGRRGVMHGDYDPLTPGLFPAERNDLYPVWFLLKELLRYKSWKILPSDNPEPLVFISLVLRKDNNYLVAMTNVTGRDIRVDWPRTLVPSACWFMDEKTLDALRRGENIWREVDRTKRIRLRPFATVLVEATG